MNDEPSYIVCGYYDINGLHAEGSVLTHCCNCDTRLWLAPTGIDLVATHDATPICWACMTKMVEKWDKEKTPVELEPLNDEQIREISNTTGQSPEQIKKQALQLARQIIEEGKHE